MVQTIKITSEAEIGTVVYNNTVDINGYKVLLYKQQQKGHRIIWKAYIEQSEQGATIYAQDWRYHREEDTIIPDKPTFTIQTTSYGALSIPDTEKVIKRLQIAIDTVKQLDAFDWDNALTIEIEK